MLSYHAAKFDVVFTKTQVHHLMHMHESSWTAFMHKYESSLYVRSCKLGKRGSISVQARTWEFMQTLSSPSCTFLPSKYVVPISRYTPYSRAPYYRLLYVARLSKSGCYTKVYPRRFTFKLFVSRHFALPDHV
jgi:hypothetical protein